MSITHQKYNIRGNLKEESNVTKQTTNTRRVHSHGFNTSV